MEQSKLEISVTDLQTEEDKQTETDPFPVKQKRERKPKEVIKYYGIAQADFINLIKIYCDLKDRIRSFKEKHVFYNPTEMPVHEFRDEYKFFEI